MHLTQMPARAGLPARDCLLRPYVDVRLEDREPCLPKRGRHQHLGRQEIPDLFAGKIPVHPRPE